MIILTKRSLMDKQSYELKLNVKLKYVTMIQHRVPSSVD